MIHKKKFLICYSDTDAGNVVHHARYFCIFERARTEMMLELGIMTSDLQKLGYSGFVIAQSKIRYKRSLYLEDEIEIQTYIDEISGSRVFVRHIIEKEGNLITDCRIELALIDKNGRPVEVPENIKNLLLKYKN